MIRKVISGGQTGADQAGLEAARLMGIPTAGWAPKGWRTETGRDFRLRDFWGLKECPSKGYPERTRLNVLDADLTVWFGSQTSPGYYCTMNAITIRLGVDPAFKGMYIASNYEADLLEFLEQNPEIQTLNIAGNRESKNPGIYATTLNYLVHVFKELGHAPIGD